MNATHDPHHAEYLAAAAGLHEQTVSPAKRPAIGDFVSGRTGGKTWSGRVWDIDGDRISVEIDGGWLAVPVSDITH